VSTHRPFEEWILEGPALHSAQDQLLRDHLLECPDCRRLAEGWSVVHRRLSEAPVLGPQPGFPGRWLRYQAVHARPRRAGAWAVLAISLGASLAAAGLVAWGLASALSSPSAILQAWIRQLVTLSLWVRVGGGILDAASGAVPSTLLAGLGVALMLAWAGLIGVWLLSLRRISYQGVST
jgi:hypothetical protein